MKEVLHLDFNPISLSWLGGLQARLAQSSSPRLRERYQLWASVGLGELALAIATRLAITRRVEDRLRECLSALVQEIEQSGGVDTHLSGEYCYRPSDEGLLFDICAAVDSCFFEWRSLYEVLGKFALTFAREMLGREISESQIVSIVEEAGVPLGWISQLRESRKLFFHQTAPWIALEVTRRQPLECAIVIMKENLAIFEDAEKYVTEAQLIEASNGLRQSIIAVRNWLHEQLVTLEAT